MRRWGSAISTVSNTSFGTKDSDVDFLVESALCTADSLFRSTEGTGFLAVVLAVVFHDTEEGFFGSQG